MTRELEATRELVTCAICVQLYRDARVLSCSHSFCFNCLIGCLAQAEAGDSTSVGCPICRELTVPILADVHLLPSNAFVNKVAEIIRNDDSLAEAQPGAVVEPQADGADDGQFFVGNLLPESSLSFEDSLLRNQWILGAVIAAIPIGASVIFQTLSALVATVITMLSVVLLVGSWWTRQNRNDVEIHTYTCNSCGGEQRSTVKYRCGMCNDFNLCPSCFVEDNLSLRHHIFLKLKFQQRRELPLGPVLKPQAFGLAETFDYDNQIHGKAYVHSPDRLIRLSAIKCSFCGMMPINGTRYKCGMCKNYDLCSNCETHSHKIHDKSHVFMVIKHKADVNFISEPLVHAQFY